MLLHGANYAASPQDSHGVPFHMADGQSPVGSRPAPIAKVPPIRSDLGLRIGHNELGQLAFGQCKSPHWKWQRQVENVWSLWTTKKLEDKKENRKQLKHCEGYNIFGFPQGERYPRYPVIFRELNMLRPFRKRRNNYTSIRGVTAPKQLEHINASQEW